MQRYHLPPARLPLTSPLHANRRHKAPYGVINPAFIFHNTTIFANFMAWKRTIHPTKKDTEMNTSHHQATTSGFIIRSYSKSELAMLYSPFITSKAAVKKLNRWIAVKPGLCGRLQDTGMQPHAKCYTPYQVYIIVEALGEPEMLL